MIETLLRQMTLKEKIGQLNQRLYGWEVYEKTNGKIMLTETFKKEVARFGSLGWIYGVFRADPWSGRNQQTGLTTAESYELSLMIQTYLQEHTRLGIPAFLSEECPHGHQGLEATTFPVNFSVGSSWNPDLYQAAQTITAQEIRAKGAHVGLVSALDIARDPRWGRTEECFSEDPFLTSSFTKAAVRGLQGSKTTIEKQNVLAVLKHFAAQGAGMGGHNAGPVAIGDREFREIHLPPMKAGIAAGALGCMAAYNDLDGVPCHANAYLLQDVLREESGFAGIVMADGCGLDRIADWLGSRPQAAAKSLTSGVDVSLWDEVFPVLEEAVLDGLIAETVIDEAVRRVLLLKEKLGLFKEATPHVSLPDKEKARQASLKLAEESVVLLENNGILPLKKTRQKIAVIGPHVKQLYHQLGDYTPFKEEAMCMTLWEGLTKLNTHQVDFAYEKGCEIANGTTAQRRRACQIAEDADVILVTIGGSSARDFTTDFDKNGAALRGSQEMTSGENIDLATLDLPQCQLDLLFALKKRKKPLIGIVISGRPHCLAPLKEVFDGLLYAGYPGQYGGEAIARILFGETVPSGKLAVSIPDTVGQLPVCYNYRNTAFQKDYLDQNGAPVYSFGYGLSYASFTCSAVSAEYAGEGIIVSGTLENHSAVSGKEVIQCYLKEYTKAYVPRKKVLCGFQKVWVPNQGQVAFQLVIDEASVQQLAISLKDTASFCLEVETAGQQYRFLFQRSNPDRTWQVTQKGAKE